ncbi:MAG TPA: hypothetical protein VLT32_05220 [Candidatus Sulfomarinibacteraceae bacterium]|nr:hypothetical protein [Candidatus Sulfomarinibacteraceae bacterium]
MKRSIIGILLGVALLAFGAAAAGADELTVDSILSAHRSGASARGIISMVNNPSNTVAMSAGDILTLRNAGVPEAVITAVWNRTPAPAPAPVPLEPDDARLLDLVSLIDSGMSESIIAEQIRQSEQAYNLSVNDLLYLKQNGAQETMIVALMATSTGAPGAPSATTVAAPSNLSFDDLVMVKTGLWGFLSKDRTGRLVMDGDTLSWRDDRGSDKSFQFQTSGIDKVWLTCEARPSANFCHQINFKIVKGDEYKFQDSGRDSGSNAAVLAVMEALRTYFPRLNFGTPNIDG